MTPEEIQKEKDSLDALIFYILFVVLGIAWLIIEMKWY